jgi:hypothetical protein
MVMILLKLVKIKVLLHVLMVLVQLLQMTVLQTHGQIVQLQVAIQVG